LSIRIKFVVAAAVGKLEEAFNDMLDPIAVASKNAMSAMANDIKLQGRINIGAAGFSTKWQNAFRVDVYPKGKRPSASAAALVYHKIPYADVFETGATIRGKPMLWIPLPSIPRQINRRKMTPDMYVQKIGPLFSIKRGPGKPPLLMAKISKNKRGGVGKITNKKLRVGASGAGASTAVPVFVGVDAVSLRKRFDLRFITDTNVNRLYELYHRHFKDAA